MYSYCKTMICLQSIFKIRLIVITARMLIRMLIMITVMMITIRMLTMMMMMMTMMMIRMLTMMITMMMIRMLIMMMMVIIMIRIDKNADNYDYGDDDDNSADIDSNLNRSSVYLSVLSYIFSCSFSHYTQAILF